MKTFTLLQMSFWSAWLTICMDVCSNGFQMFPLKVLLVALTTFLCTYTAADAIRRRMS